MGPNRLPRIWVPGAAIVLVSLGFLVYAVSQAVPTLPRVPNGPVGAANVFGSVSDFGNALFTVYLLPFEVTALILMVAVIGVITLGGEEMRDAAPRGHERKVERTMREAILREGTD
jgi:NADH:ubiquinone oxidoreductase subunit 6 (subunit J)